MSGEEESISPPGRPSPARAAPAWLGLDRPAAIHALTLFVAALTAYSIASLLHVQNAYWAVMPVWVVAQLRRGLLFERALFRVLGTLLGSAAGFAILHVFPAPLLAIAALALWVGVSAGLTHLLRKVHSYAALMAGITAAVVVLPSLLMPERSAGVALARVECTLIGVITVTLVTGWFTPGVERDMFYARVRRLTGDAVAYVAALLRAGGQAAAERRLLIEISEVETYAVLVAAGSIDGYRRRRHVNAFFAASLSLMALGQQLYRQRAPASWAADPLPDMLDALAARLRGGAPLADARPELERWLAQARSVHPRLAYALEQLIDAEAALFADDSRPTPRPGRRALEPAPHREWPLALRTGLVSGLLTLVAATLGLVSGWRDGELAAVGVCTFTMVLGSLPKPHEMARQMIKGVGAGVLLALLYRLLILPHVVSVGALILSVAPFLLLGALARAAPKTALPAIDGNMCFLLVGQAVLPAVTDPGATLGAALALLLAAGMVTTGYILLPRDPAMLGADAARQIRADLRRLIRGAGDGGAGWRPRALRQILRLMLHTGRAKDLRGKAPQGVLAALNLGNAVVDMHALREAPATGAGGRAALEQGLRLLAGFEDDPVASAQRLGALAEAAGEPAAQALRDAADALRQGAALFGPASAAGP